MSPADTNTLASPRQMATTIRLGSIVALVVVAIQWVVVADFVSHSYTLWLKVSSPQITAGVYAALLFTGGSFGAVIFSAFAYDRLHRSQLNFRFVPLLTAVLGSAGLLVFYGLVAVGYVIFVQR